MASKSGTAPKPTNALKTWEKIDAPLVRLHLDLNNPRHEPAATEEEAVGFLFESERAEALASDIAEQRAMSPFDTIGVIDMPGNPGHYVAVEGNRRLCALLLLNDPDRAPTPAIKARLRVLRSQVTLPSTIEVIRFESRDQAKYWISLRHLGPQEGQGLVSWNAAQKSRATDDGGPNALAVAILDRAKEGEWLGRRGAPAVTTLTRYLKNREVRAALGLGHHRDLIFTHDQAEVDAALRQFLTDAFPTADDSPALVNSRSKDADRAKYARDLRERGVAPQTPLPTPASPTPVAPPQPSGKSNARNRPDSTNRKILVPTGFVCNAADVNLRRIFAEMRRTPIEQHEFAVTYLLRAFVERVMTLYLQKVDKGYNPANDQALVKRCSEKLDPTSANPKFKP